MELCGDWSWGVIWLQRSHSLPHTSSKPSAVGWLTQSSAPPLIIPQAPLPLSLSPSLLLFVSRSLPLAPCFPPASSNLTDSSVRNKGHMIGIGRRSDAESAVGTKQSNWERRLHHRVVGWGGQARITWASSWKCAQDSPVVVWSHISVRGSVEEVYFKIFFKSDTTSWAQPWSF